MDDRKDRARQQRMQRQNQALKDQQVIDGSSFNDPFKYKAPVRQKRSTSSATNKLANANSRVIISIPIRLYLLNDKKLELCKCTTPSNDIDEMTHTLSLTTSMTGPIESVTMICCDAEDNKTPILSLDIDSMFSFTLLAPGTNTALRVQSAMVSDDKAAYSIVSPQLDKIARYIALSKYFAMEAEVRQGLTPFEITQDVHAAPFSSPLIEYGDLVKVRYTTYAVSEFGDYENASVVDRVAQCRFEVGSGECPLPGVESHAIGMRKRNIRACIISRDSVSADSEWPILLKSGTFLVCEIAILNHRQSSEPANDKTSVLQWNASHSSLPSSSSTTSTRDADHRSTQPPSSTTASKRTKAATGDTERPRRSEKKSSRYDLSDDETRDGDDDELFFGSTSSKSKSRKVSTAVGSEKRKSKKNPSSRRSGPFDDGNDDDGDDHGPEYDDDSSDDVPEQPTTRSTKSNRHASSHKSKQSNQDHSDDDDDDDDDDFSESHSSEFVTDAQRSESVLPTQQQQQSLPTFNVDQQNVVNSQETSSQHHQQQQQQQAHQQYVDPDIKKKENLSERMRRLATASGMGPAIPVVVPFGGSGATPSLNPISEPSTPIPQAPLQQSSYQPQQQPQQQYHYSQPQTQPQPQPTQQQPPQQYYQSQHQPQYDYGKQQQSSQVFPGSPHLYQTNSYHSTTSAPTPLNNTSTTAALLAELGLSQYHPQLVNEQLFTVSDLLLLDKDDWAGLPFPMIVKRKIRSRIGEIQANPNSNPPSSPSMSQPTSTIATTTASGATNNSTAAPSPHLSSQPTTVASPEPTPVPVSQKMVSALSESQLQTEITNAYNKGCEQTLAKCRQRITDMKNTANTRFNELQEEISQRDLEITRLTQELEAMTKENARNKELVRTYVEKTRQERSVDAAEISRLKAEAQSQQEYIQRLTIEHKAEQKAVVRSALETVYTTFISRLGSNEVIDGEQVHKILRDVLKSTGS